MGKVTFNMSMSLDGFVSGAKDGVDQLFKWYFSGDTELPFPGSDFVFKLSAADVKRIQDAAGSIGAMVTGRRNFEDAHAWNGHPPMGVHHFVVTHRDPEEWVKPEWPFTYVKEGVESAIAQAKAHAGDKDVVISSASILRQGLQAGLVDEITIDLVPLLLGDGVRLFQQLGIEPVELEQIGVSEGIGVTHLAYRVAK